MFEHVEDAMRALQELNGFYIFGKQLKVSIARPRDGGSKGCKLHVSKLPVHYTWEMVHSLFSQVIPPQTPILPLAPLIHLLVR
jgi:RNA recognition motif-containing protein